MNSFNYLHELHKIQCPTFLMVGEDSPGHPPKAAEEMASKIPAQHLNYHLFKNCGAPVYNDAPSEAEQAVRNFLQHQVF